VKKAAAVHRLATTWSEAAEGEAIRAKVEREASAATTVVMPAPPEHWALAVPAAKMAPILQKAAVMEAVAAEATTEAAAAVVAGPKLAALHSQVVVVAAAPHTSSRVLWAPRCIKAGRLIPATGK
jgi:hypothetical protein